MPLERTHLPQERRSPANPKQTAQTAGPAKRGPSLPPERVVLASGGKAFSSRREPSRPGCYLVLLDVPERHGTADRQ